MVVHWKGKGKGSYSLRNILCVWPTWLERFATATSPPFQLILCSILNSEVAGSLQNNCGRYPLKSRENGTCWPQIPVTPTRPYRGSNPVDFNTAAGLPDESYSVCARIGSPILGLNLRFYRRQTMGEDKRSTLRIAQATQVSLPASTTVQLCGSTPFSPYIAAS